MLAGWYQKHWSFACIENSSSLFTCGRYQCVDKATILLQDFCSKRITKTNPCNQPFMTLRWLKDMEMLRPSDTVFEEKKKVRVVRKSKLKEQENHSEKQRRTKFTNVRWIVSEIGTRFNNFYWIEAQQQVPTSSTANHIKMPYFWTW